LAERVREVRVIAYHCEYNSRVSFRSDLPTDSRYSVGQGTVDQPNNCVAEPVER
jgi:hypothetical protein